jgi:hypothetical protein
LASRRSQSAAEPGKSDGFGRKKNQVRNLEQVGRGGDEATEGSTGETLERSGAGERATEGQSSEAYERKVAGNRGRGSRRIPGGGRNPMRGATDGEANHRTEGTLSRADRDLEVERRRAWDCLRTESARSFNGKGVGSSREGGWLHGKRSP